MYQQLRLQFSHSNKPIPCDLNNSWEDFCVAVRPLTDASSSESVSEPEMLDTCMLQCVLTQVLVVLESAAWCALTSFFSETRRSNSASSTAALPTDLSLILNLCQSLLKCKRCSVWLSKDGEDTPEADVHMSGAGLALKQTQVIRRTYQFHRSHRLDHTLLSGFQHCSRTKGCPDMHSAQQTNHTIRELAYLRCHPERPVLAADRLL